MNTRNTRIRDGASWTRNLALLGLTAIMAVWSGNTLADEYPEGCVSCHIGDKAKPGSAYRLDLQLATLGHGKGGERTEDIPTGCFRCHNSNGEGPAGKLGPYVHLVHFRGDKNPFLKKYGGDCSSCHRMDPETWRAVAKSGIRNWTLGGGDANPSQ